MIDEAVVVENQRVVILGDHGATLTRGGGTEPVITARGVGTTVELYDVAIVGSSNLQTIGIHMPSGAPTVRLIRVTVRGNAGLGISASVGSLTISQSKFLDGDRGAIDVNGTATFVILNSVFVRNGGTSSPQGAIRISVQPATTNRLEFNSFHKNEAANGVGAAIQCAAGDFTARHNIAAANGTLTNLEQVGGGCKHTRSIVWPGTVPPGLDNLAIDPRFLDDDLHLAPDSPARAAADRAADLTGLAAVDHDGILRVSPSTIGAHQLP